jgi:hypothetical protein
MRLARAIAPLPPLMAGAALAAERFGKHARLRECEIG